MTTTDPLSQAGAQYEEYVRLVEISSLAELVSEQEDVQTEFVAPALGFVTA